jgi:hypothetical protein
LFIFCDGLVAVIFYGDGLRKRQSFAGGIVALASPVIGQRFSWGM